MLFDVIIVFKGDDYVFKVLLNNFFFVISCFCYLFVLNEKNNLDIRRCKNIYCDCRLYYCILLFVCDYVNNYGMYFCVYCVSVRVVDGVLS